MKKQNYYADQDDSGLDFLSITLLVFLAIVIIIIQHIAVPGKKEEESTRPQGNLIVEIFWDDEIDCDVDLWVQAPGDKPVGYSNKGGIIFNLLRDDLGKNSDVSKRNMEVAYTRGIPDGEYIINVHLFNLKSASLPVAVLAIVTLNDMEDGKKPARQILVSNVELTQAKQELTVVRFTFKDQKLVENSLHRVPKNIRGFDPGELGGP